MQAKPRPANRGEALLNVWRHFIIEGHPQAISPDGLCQYRTHDGTNGCAIGCQLPDDFELLDELVGLNLSYGEYESGVSDVLDSVAAYLNVHGEDLELLQEAHDESYSLADMETKLRKLAMEWDVNLTSR